MTEGYENGKIYKIVCNITNETYIGSTRRSIETRMNEHRVINNICESKHIIERGDYTVSLIEDFPCRNKEELRWRERYYIESIECINKQVPIISAEERKEREQNKYLNNKARWNTDDAILKRKIYREDPVNKARQKETQALWYINNIERHKTTGKEYRETHREERRAYEVAYRENNIDKLKIKNQQDWERKKATLTTITCGCGNTYYIRNKNTQANHEKCKKHLNWVANSLAKNTTPFVASKF